MFSQFVCLCLLTSLLGLVSSQTNYVQNGDLSTPNISMTQAKISTPGGILGWTGTVVEIGFGRIYNSYWQPYLPVMNLDTGANQVVTQTITLISPSLYTLCF